MLQRNSNLEAVAALNEQLFCISSLVDGTGFFLATSSWRHLPLICLQTTPIRKWIIEIHFCYIPPPDSGIRKNQVWKECTGYFWLRFQYILSFRVVFTRSVWLFTWFSVQNILVKYRLFDYFWCYSRFLNQELDQNYYYKYSIESPWIELTR